ATSHSIVAGVTSTGTLRSSNRMVGPLPDERTSRFFARSNTSVAPALESSRSRHAIVVSGSAGPGASAAATPQHSASSTTNAEVLALFISLLLSNHPGAGRDPFR